MANSLQARKRARQAEKHRQHNASQRTNLRTHIKNVVKAIQSGDKSVAEAEYSKAVPVIDSASNNGHIHKNKAARHKSRLNTHIREMQA